MSERRPFRFTSAIVLILIGFLAGFALNALVPSSRAAAGPSQPRAVEVPAALGAGEESTIALFEAASPSVVFITTLDVRRDFFSRNVMEIPRGTGSGFVWDNRGHIVTNYHVIQGGNAVQVTSADRTTWQARLIGVAPQKDLAVLKITAPPAALRPIPVGRSATLRVGQDVFAIGNPFGLDQTLTTGIISALGREIMSVARIPIRDVIQTDAAINPGNSGGPLLDSSGRLIGVNTAIYSPSGGSAGIGFSIPVDEVNWVVPELITHGRIRRPTLGIRPASPNLTRRWDIEGALVLFVERNSGAERAGIRPTVRDARGRIVLGDIIVSVDGQPVRTADDLTLLLERRQAGERVRLIVVRDGRREAIDVTLDEAR